MIKIIENFKNQINQIPTILIDVGLNSYLKKNLLLHTHNESKRIKHKKNNLIINQEEENLSNMIRCDDKKEDISAPSFSTILSSWKVNEKRKQTYIYIHLGESMSL